LGYVRACTNVSDGLLDRRDWAALTPR